MSFLIGLLLFFSIRGLSVEVAVILVSTDIVEDVVLEAVAVATVLSASFLLLLLESFLDFR
ncbi:TPA: hypothetical protein VCA04_002073 [Streptococcus suis]|nr:hypothetical protein [Streptococcus suis]HEM2714788.1 hypothetical protein [Streptococcus suis]HEP1783841.1 hypothetical protein [Streptococcus suis]